MTDFFTASLSLENTFELTDSDGNVIAEQVDVRADFHGSFEGDSLTNFGANGAEVRAYKPLGEDEWEAKWIEIPEYLKEPFERWLALEKTRAWFAEQVHDQDTYEG